MDENIEYVLREYAISAIITAYMHMISIKKRVGCFTAFAFID